MSRFKIVKVEPGRDDDDKMAEEIVDGMTAGRGRPPRFWELLLFWAIVGSVIYYGLVITVLILAVRWFLS